MVKEGYKQTEIGLIPEQWELTPFASISSMNGRIGWQGLRQEEFTFNDEDPFLITGMNFKDGQIRWNEVYHIPKERYELAKQIQLNSNDILMTKDGTIGKLLYVDYIPFPYKASLNSHLLLFRPKNHSYDPKFMFYQLHGKHFLQHIELSKSGSTFYGITQNAMGKFKAILPPIYEQKAIAKALGDTDELITSLNKLIAKKEAIKQGTMQQLLTGKKRLAGFSGEWEEKKLGQIGDPSMCKRIMKHETSDFGDVPFYKIGTFGKKADAFINRDIFDYYKNKFSFPKKGDILISAAGTIGRTVVYDGEPAYFQDSNIVWINNNEKIVTNSYLNWVFKITRWTTEDTTIARLYNDNLKNLSMLIPSTINEQNAITKILSDMDDEIEMLKTKLTKTKAIKEAMMSELLTGKTRLNIQKG